jgi:hypothetical protein
LVKGSGNWRKEEIYELPPGGLGKHRWGRHNICFVFP